MDRPVLRISLLGGFELRLGTDIVSLESGRMRSLLAWLALHIGAPQPRQRISSALWPESAEQQARTNLRNLLHQLRRAVPLIDDYLVSTATTLEWRVDARINVDVGEFELALSTLRADPKGSREAAALEAALALYTGPLLPDHYEGWLEEHRSRLARMHHAGQEALVERFLEQENYEGALRTADRILLDEPLNERAHRTRIACLTRLGDRAGAVRAYHECETRLSGEVGVTPSRATKEAYEEALDPENTRSEAREQEIQPIPFVAARDGPLVGRSAERAALQRLWLNTLESHAGMAWVTGEPGIGKTRLVQSVAEWIGRQGSIVLEARAYETHGALAYGPVIAWLRSRLLAAFISQADGVVRHELGRLLPELRHADAPESDPYMESERRQRIHDAVLHVLSMPPVPCALVLDDLHWADSETIDLLHAIVMRSQQPLLVLATVRLEEVEPDEPLMRIGTRLAEAGRLDRVHLQPLGRRDTALLASDLCGTVPTEIQVEALYRETEGNPLFIVETVRSGGPWGARGEAGATSPRIRAVIEARLALLSPEGMIVIRVAATIGRAFTLPLLVLVSPLSEGATLRGIDEAWRRGLVREREDGGYDFSHEKIREVAYRITSPVRRREYHQRIAGTLAHAWTKGGAAPDVTLDQIALHHDRGGEFAEAVDWYGRAARASVDVSALTIARRLFERALALLARLPPGAARDAKELDLRLALGAVLVALEGYGRDVILETYQRARELCANLERPVPAPVLRALGLAALAHGDLVTGTRLADEITNRADAEDDDIARVEGEYLAGVMAFWRGNLAESERRLVQAIEWYRPERRGLHVRLYSQDPKIVCLSRLAWTLWERGHVRQALERRAESLALVDGKGDPHGSGYALWFTQFIAIDQGDIECVSVQCERLKEIATTHGLHYMDAVADGFLGYVAAMRGDPREGISRMRFTIEDPRWTDMAYVLRPQTLLLIARAASAAGDAPSARAAVREALDYLGPGESLWKAHLYLLDARSIGSEDRTGERALPAFAIALDHARRYGARGVELRVAIDQASWCIERGLDDRVGAVEDLTRAAAFYPEDPELPAIRAARILLDRLGAAERA